MALLRGLKRAALNSWQAQHVLAGISRAYSPVSSVVAAEVTASATAASLSSSGESDQAFDRAHSGSEASTSGPGKIITTAPWPWVDPLRPQVLPGYVEFWDREKPGIRPPPTPVAAALDKVKANSTQRMRGSASGSGRPRHSGRFDESVELMAKFSVDPRKPDQIVRGLAVLPHGTGKKVRVAVFAQGADADVARAEGADVVGGEELIVKIIETNGEIINFDRLIATPDFMKPLARAGRVLGPKGLMPNPKMGTLTSNVAGAIREMRAGRLEFRVGRDKTLAAVVGKVSFSSSKLLENVGALAKGLLDHRPATLPGSGFEGYMTGMRIKSSMTSPVDVSVASLHEAINAYVAASSGKQKAAPKAEAAAPAAAAEAPKAA